MATAAAAADAPKGGGGLKKIIIIVAVVAVVVVAGGIGLLMFMSKKAAADDDGSGDAAPTKHVERKKGELPVFVPLDPFTVNLADKEVDRFAQIGITLEVTDAKAAEDIKAYLPAIRSNVLVLLSHKTSAELLTPEGKEKLAHEIMREAVRPMGIDVPDDDDDSTSGDAPSKKKKKHAQVETPISDVLFSSFIVQ